MKILLSLKRKMASRYQRFIECSVVRSILISKRNHGVLYRILHENIMDETQDGLNMSKEVFVKEVEIVCKDV